MISSQLSQVVNFRGTLVSPMPLNRWLCTFTDTVTKEKKELYDVIGYMPIFSEYHVTSVSVPTGLTARTERSQGYNFPVVEVDEAIGVESFTVTFAEESHVPILRFENWMRRKIIDNRGYHRSQAVNRIDEMRLAFLDYSDTVICEYIFENVYFVSSDEVSPSYASLNEIMNRTLTFGAGNYYFIPYVNGQYDPSKKA